MKVKKEDIENLSQLDRIEYKFEKKELEERWNSSFIPLFNFFLFNLIIIILLCLVLSFQLLDQFGAERMSEFFIVIPAIFVGFAYFIFALICLRLISLAIYLTKLNKLNKKFFEDRK